jgi:hypothetical protein
MPELAKFNAGGYIIGNFAVYFKGKVKTELTRPIAQALSNGDLCAQP